MRKAPRWSIRAFVVLLLAAAAVPVYFVANQWLFRWRASRLFSDVRRMELRKSTWADFRRFQTRWGRWGHYEGTCTSLHCEYQVMLENDRVSNLAVSETGELRHLTLLHWLHHLGVREAIAYAGLKFENSSLVERGASLGVYAPDQP
jgi:hypothetical protein